VDLKDRRLLKKLYLLVGIGLTVLLVIGLAGNLQYFKKSPAPPIEKGIMDLRNWPLNNSPISLAGQWKFIPNKWVMPDSFQYQTHEYIKVPNPWGLKQGMGMGTYQLTILLPPGTSNMALEMLDVSTAYRLFINTSTPTHIGILGNNENTSKPTFTHRLHSIYAPNNYLTITLQVSNFQYIQGGILTAPKLGNYNQLLTRNKLKNLIGILMIGGLLACFCFHIGFSLYRTTRLYHSYMGLTCLFLAIHILCINDRFLHNFIDSWALLIKTEHAAFLLSAFFGLLSNADFFSVPKIKFHKYFITAIFVPVICIILFTPIYFSSNFFLTANPLLMVIGFSYINIISIQAYKRKIRGHLVFIVINLIMLVSVVFDQLFYKQHIGELVLGHIGLFIYLMYSTLLLTRQSALNFVKIDELSDELVVANKKLSEQNMNLENLVEEKTRQILEIEKKAHLLEIENKQRDLEAFVLNNQVKKEISREMVSELEVLQKSDKNLKIELKKFISQLKQKFGLSEKLDVFEQESDKVNTDFFNRLTNLYPSLTKTERELCSLIKLNLSNKEMAILLKTTADAIYASRTRVRKKLSVPEGVDLDVFIRKI
jgi:hypothetical protein